MGVAAVKAQHVSGYKCWLLFFSTYICRKMGSSVRHKERLCQAVIERENYLWHNTICIACMTAIWCSGELCLWIIVGILAMLVVTLNGKSDKGHFVSRSYLWYSGFLESYNHSVSLSYFQLGLSSSPAYLFLLV